MSYFKENKYVIVKNILSKEIVDITSQYAILDELTNYQGNDNQVSNSHSVYGDKLMESLLLKLQPSIEYATGLELLPTYSYYRVYREGNELKKHKDRPSCEISATVCFNYNYVGNPTYEWPMFVKGKPLLLEPGDAIIYRGMEVDHWRDPFQITRIGYHIQGFFHYVDKKGPHTEHALDKRAFIGAPLKDKSKVKKDYITYTS